MSNDLSTLKDQISGLERVQIREVQKLEQMEKSQNRQWKELEEVSESLKGIQQILNKIQYIGIGMGGFYIVQELGFSKILAKLIT